jgi:hypothetical protein
VLGLFVFLFLVIGGGIASAQAANDPDSGNSPIVTAVGIGVTALAGIAGTTYTARSGSKDIRNQVLAESRRVVVRSRLEALIELLNSLAVYGGLLQMLVSAFLGEGADSPRVAELNAQFYGAGLNLRAKAEATEDESLAQAADGLQHQGSELLARLEESGGAMPKAELDAALRDLESNLDDLFRATSATRRTASESMTSWPAA